MNKIVSSESTMKLFIQLKPFIGVVFLQLGVAGMGIYLKVALNQGLSAYIFTVYRHAVATLIIAPFAIVLEKTKRPKMTTSMLVQFALLGLLEPVIGTPLYIWGLKYTTATFAAAMTNILPAIAFILAWIFGLEKMNFSSIRTQAKVFGTMATVVGAMIMTFVKGPILELFRKTETINHGIQNTGSGTDVENVIKGSIVIIGSMFSWACFMVLQAVTLKTYPAVLSLTTWICLFGTAEGAIVAMFMERNRDLWAIHFDNKFMVAVYGGIVCSGLAYYIQGIVMKQRGPVFVTAFTPLCMVIVAILESFILGELLFLGRFVGAMVIIVGLYLIIWGKSNDYDSPSQPSIDDHIAADGTINYK